MNRTMLLLFLMLACSGLRAQVFPSGQLDEYASRYCLCDTVRMSSGEVTLVRSWPRSALALRNDVMIDRRGFLCYAYGMPFAGQPKNGLSAQVKAWVKERFPQSGDYVVTERKDEVTVTGTLRPAPSRRQIPVSVRYELSFICTKGVIHVRQIYSGYDEGETPRFRTVAETWPFNMESLETHQAESRTLVLTHTFANLLMDDLQLFMERNSGTELPLPFDVR